MTTPNALTATQLIAALQKLVAQHGDCNVATIQHEEYIHEASTVRMVEVEDGVEVMPGDATPRTETVFVIETW